jgi:hypothetical protein
MIFLFSLTYFNFLLCDFEIRLQKKLAIIPEFKTHIVILQGSKGSRQT